MSQVQMIKSFLNSDAYHMLSEEAEYNEHAMELLECIELSISSLIFFKQNKITNRVNLEFQSLEQTFQHINEIYEKQ